MHNGKTCTLLNALLKVKVLNNPVNGFLDGLIDKGTYLKKKDELIQLKLELSQKRSDFACKGLLWVEPLRVAGSVGKSRKTCFFK